MRLGTKLAALAATLPLSLLLSGHAAHWNMFRADVHRTGSIEGSGEIAVLSVKWKYYAGGALTASQLIVADVNNDGALEHLLVSGGKVLCKLASDVLIWDTPYVAAARLWAVDDFDGDGRREVLVSTSLGRLMLFGAADGKLLWENPDEDFNWIGTVKVTDIDGDGLPDVYAADQACGSATRQPAAEQGGARAYTFKDGVASPAVLFTLEPKVRDYYCGTHNEIADIDNDGHPEVIAAGDAYVYAYSTVDGKLKYKSAALGAFPWGSPSIITVDADNDGAAEIFLYVSSPYVRGSKRLLALKPAGAELQLMWQAALDAATYQRDAIQIAPGFVADLDRDGTVETVYSVYDGATATWSVVVADAAYRCSVGAGDRFTTCVSKKLTLPKARFQGVADLDGDGVAELIITDLKTNTTGVYHYTALPAPAFTRISTLPAGAAVLPEYDDAIARSRDYATALLTFDYGATGARALMGLRAGALEAYDTSKDPATVLGSVDTAPSTSRTFSRAVRDPVRKDVEHLVSHVSDGTVGVLGPLLQPLNDLDGDGAYDLRSGGFAASMLITDLEKDGRPEIIVTRSGGFISAMDGLTTDLVNPPRLLWSRTGGLPTVADLDGDGVYEMLYGAFEGINLIVDVLKPDLTRKYFGVVGVKGETDGFYQDLIVGNADGDARLDIYYTYTDPNNNLAKYGVLAWDGVSPAAAKLWQTEVGLSYQGDGQGSRTVADVNADGRDEFIINPYREIRSLNAADGALIAKNTDGHGYAGAVTFFENVFIKHGGQTGTTYAAPAAFKPSDLSSLWVSPVKGEYSGRHGAALKSPLGGSFFAQIRVDSPHLYVYTVQDGNVIADRVLACGRAFDSEVDAAAAGCAISEIAAVIGVRDLTGLNEPAFIAGARDGRVYAVAAGTGALLWAYDFRYPVSDLIAGDLDGDGKIEILASVGDGYVYALDNAELPAPAYVYDNDGVTAAAGDKGPGRCPADPGEDLDCQEVTSTLGANWGAVAGADGYEYAIVSQNGTYITYWTDAGDATTVVTRDLRLVFEFEYFFIVRAYRSSGGKKITSPEAQSDGVKIVDSTPPTVTVAPDPAVITPDGDGLNDATVIHALITDRTSVVEWRLDILDPSGAKVLARPVEHVSATRVEADLPWDGMAAGKRLPGGTYRVVAYATDIGGHAALGEAPLLICDEFMGVGEEGGRKVCVCPDRDNDGYTDMRCGGTDCDDYDRMKHPGAYEDCAADMNCDGKPVICDAGTKCLDGWCVGPCQNGECPAEFTCQNNYCIPTGLCATVHCEGDLVCVDGACVDLCRGVYCGDAGVCVKGACVSAGDGGAPDGSTDAAKPDGSPDGVKHDTGGGPDDTGGIGGGDGGDPGEAPADAGGCSCAVVEI